MLDIQGLVTQIPTETLQEIYNVMRNNECPALTTREVVKWWLAREAVRKGLYSEWPEKRYIAHSSAI